MATRLAARHKRRLRQKREKPRRIYALRRVSGPLTSLSRERRLFAIRVALNDSLSRGHRWTEAYLRGISDACETDYANLVHLCKQFNVILIMLTCLRLPQRFINLFFFCPRCCSDINDGNVVKTVNPMNYQKCFLASIFPLFSGFFLAL